MKVPLAGGDAAGNPTETLLSEVGLVLLKFFNTREACALRLVCREFVEAVRRQQWEDGATVIRGSIAAWRACFPRARCANVGMYQDTFNPQGRRANVFNTDFVHFEGLRSLNMNLCGSVTDAAFVHLRGIHTLRMSFCSGITDAGMAHLVGIQRLNIFCCTGLTDTAFAPLRGIQVLNMSFCLQFTDAAFLHLRGIHTLCIAHCDQPAISDAAFVHLRGIHTLYMARCNQPAISDAAFVHLKGIHTLCIDLCDQASITGATLAQLKGSLAEVNMRGCWANAVAAAREGGLPVSQAYITVQEYHGFL
jgi:hypothetical protein